MDNKQWLAWVRHEAPIYSQKRYRTLAAKGYKLADIRAIMEAEAVGWQATLDATKKAEEKSKAEARRKSHQIKAKLKGK